MEKQQELFENMRNKKEKIENLKEHYFSNFDKIIAEFGNLDSKILILGISPVSSHYNSESASCFAFDINLKQTQKSGGILCKTFEQLGINIEEVLWDNIFKTPEEMLTDDSRNAALKYMKEFIKLINPKLIICLGNSCQTAINKVIIDKNIRIVKVLHPAAHLRGFYSFEEYVKNWERLKLGEIK